MGFFGDMFEGASGKKAANAGADAASAYTNSGYQNYRDQVGGGYGNADSILQGYEAPGKQANSLYAGSIGALGTQGYQNALSNFNADPFRQGQADAAGRAVRDTYRRYNGQGMGNSGTAGAAVGRVGSDIYGQQVADYRNRLMGMGQQGMQIGSQRAQNAIGQGEAMGGSYVNQNNQLAGIEQQRQQNIYQAQQQGQNNLMKAVGSAAQLATMGFAPGLGGATAFGNMAGMFGGGGQGGGGQGGGGSNYLSGYTNGNAYGGPR
jgi:hypothetical protein